MIYKLDEKWNIPCWILDDKTRFITWTKNTEKVKSNIVTFEKTDSLFINDKIKHNKYGMGIVTSKIFTLDNGKKSFQMTNDLGQKYNVYIDEVEKQIQKYDFV